MIEVQTLNIETVMILQRRNPTSNKLGLVSNLEASAVEMHRSFCSKTFLHYVADLFTKFIILLRSLKNFLHEHCIYNRVDFTAIPRNLLVKIFLFFVDLLNFEC